MKGSGGKHSVQHNIGNAGRSAKQVRERWKQYADPSLRFDPWTPDEDAQLVAAQAIHGNRWAKISPLIPGRPHPEPQPDLPSVILTQQLRSDNSASCEKQV